MNIFIRNIMIVLFVGVGAFTNAFSKITTTEELEGQAKSFLKAIIQPTPDYQALAEKKKKEADKFETEYEKLEENKAAINDLFRKIEETFFYSIAWYEREARITDQARQMGRGPLECFQQMLKEILQPTWGDGEITPYDKNRNYINPLKKLIAAQERHLEDSFPYVRDRLISEARRCFLDSLRKEHDAALRSSYYDQRNEISLRRKEGLAPFQNEMEGFYEDALHTILVANDAGAFGE